MNDAQKIAALEAQLAEGIEAIKSREAQKDSALTHVRTEAKAALSEAQARSTKLEKRLKELEDMKLPELDDNRELDMSNPEDVKLLKILKHFGGAEILKVVQETEELQKKLSNLKQQIQSREKELKRMKDMAAEAKATVNTDVVPLEKLYVFEFQISFFFRSKCCT